jgi:hypothetical protein
MRDGFFDYFSFLTNLSYFNISVGNLISLLTPFQILIKTSITHGLKLPSKLMKESMIKGKNYTPYTDKLNIAYFTGVYRWPLFSTAQNFTIGHFFKHMVSVQLLYGIMGKPYQFMNKSNFSIFSFRNKIIPPPRDVQIFMNRCEYFDKKNIYHMEIKIQALNLLESVYP